jgi:hypothetical protein
VWRFLGWAAVVAAALYFLYIVRASLIPFLIGGVIALLLHPFVDALCRRGYSRGRAIVNVFLAFLLFTLGLGLMLAPAFYAQSQEIIQTFSRQDNGDLTKSVNSFVQQAQDYLKQEIPKRREWVERNRELLKRLELPTEPNELASALTTRLQQRVNGFLLDNAARYINSFLNTLLGLLSKAIWIILIPMSAYFFPAGYACVAAWVPVHDSARASRGGAPTDGRDRRALFPLHSRDGDSGVVVWRGMHAVLLAGGRAEPRAAGRAGGDSVPDSVSWLVSDCAERVRGDAAVWSVAPRVLPADAHELLARGGGCHRRDDY